MPGSRRARTEPGYIGGARDNASYDFENVVNPFGGNTLKRDSSEPAVSPAKREGFVSIDPASVEHVPCPHCGRGFAKNRLERHKAVCLSRSRKRKTFHSSQQRVGGTEQEKFYDSAAKRPKEEPTAAEIAAASARKLRYVRSQTIF